MEPKIQNPRDGIDRGKIEGNNEYVKMRSIAKREYIILIFNETYLVMFKPPYTHTYIYLISLLNMS